MNKKILIVGAGAVGLVYGKHFTDAGHRVTFLVREKYAEQLSDGVVLYNINEDKAKKHPIWFTEFSLNISFKEIQQQVWDQIYLCISSTALHAFDFAGFKNMLQGEPTIVMFQPTYEDYQFLCKTFPPEQIVEGMITLISYAAPLATEVVLTPGIAYYLPPFTRTPFSGTAIRRQEIIQTFREGKMAANSTESVLAKAIFPVALLTALMTALEASQWQLNALRKNPSLLKQLQCATHEIFTVLEYKHHVETPFTMRLMNSIVVIRTLLWLAPLVMPMDIETYFQKHFTKVKNQTKLYMGTYLALAKSQGSPYSILEKLNQLT